MPLKSIFAAAALFAATGAQAQLVASFKDPVGDDKGPGTYIYPTDPVFTPGSFDLTQVDVRRDGDQLSFDVHVNAPLADPWKTGFGFSTQIVFVFIRTGAGKHLDAPPGLNVQFAAPGWDKLIILAPATISRVEAEIEAKAPGLFDDIVWPHHVRGHGEVISGSVPLARLGNGDPADWSYQVVMQSFEPFPKGKAVLTREVGAYEGRFAFGGGTDTECAPRVIDVLAGGGKGTPDESRSQYAMLAYECRPDGTAQRPALLAMVHR